MAEQPALFIPLYIGSLPSNSPSLGRSPSASITTLPSRSSSPSASLSSLTSPSSGSTVNVRDSVLSDVGRNQYNRRNRSNDLRDSFNHHGDSFVDNSNHTQNNDGRRWNNSTANHNFYGSPDRERSGRMSPRQPGDFNSAVILRPKLLPPANRQRPNYPRSDTTHARGNRNHHPLSQVDEAEHDQEYFPDDDIQQNRARHPASSYDSDGEEGDDEHAPDSDDDSGCRNPSSGDGDESGMWEKWPRHGGNGARRGSRINHSYCEDADNSVSHSSSARTRRPTYDQCCDSSDEERYMERRRPSQECQYEDLCGRFPGRGQIGGFGMASCDYGVKPWADRCEYFRFCEGNGPNAARRRPTARLRSYP